MYKKYRRKRGSDVVALTITIPRETYRRIELISKKSILSTNQMAGTLLERLLDPSFHTQIVECPICGARFSVMAMFKSGGCPNRFEHYKVQKEEVR